MESVGVEWQDDPEPARSSLNNDNDDNDDDDDNGDGDDGDDGENSDDGNINIPSPRTLRDTLVSSLFNSRVSY